MQRGSVLLAILLFALLCSIILGAYIFTNYPQIPLQNPTTPTTTTNQKFEPKESPKIYTNKPLGFEFTLDQDLSAVEDSEEQYNKRGNGNFRKNFNEYIGYEPGKVLGIIAVLGKDRTFDKSPFTIWVYDNSGSIDIAGWYNKYWYYPFIWGDFDYSKEKVKLIDSTIISGEIGKGVTIDYQPEKPKLIYLNVSGKMYLVRVIGMEGEKILQTVKFLE